ncbi:hypothetical protein D3C80_2092580 [compost metagenome]
MHRAVNGAHHARQQRQPDRQHRVLELWPKERHHYNRQQQRGNGEQGIENMVQHRRAQTVGNAGKYAEDHAEKGGGQGNQ